MKRHSHTHVQGHRHITSSQIIILGFMSVILAGSLLLMLPCSTASGEGASFIEALFTSTSAVCVTGLVVEDTATYWSVFGQSIIMFLIQVGGMGVVTVAVAVTLFSGRKIGLMQRSTMQEAVSAHHVGGIVRLTKFILKTTVCIELAGAVLLLPAFIRDYGTVKGVWYAVFHSISAFCNAGFDLFGVREPFSSLTAYADQPLVNLTIMALIITGGIGFLTWEDISKNHLNFRKYHMQTKVIVTATGILILLPALYLFFFEYQGLPMGERVLSSLFQSVTPRTAGFNTTDLTAFSETGRMMIIMLMLIGGSPGSTAGGMKTTTMAVMLSSAASVFCQNEDTHLFKRRISGKTVRTAATVFVIYITFPVLGSMIISSIEGLPMLSALFETASAIGTVGLSLGITTELGLVSRLILVALMFLGRVGGLTLVFAAVSATGINEVKYPQAIITVG